ncbi:hypothetical protein I2494_03790 [Budviciaceae bacterium BWR-B9]|uniref:Uncharacterized protein n=1 Tax=Limnobaculum allomyrinae TaxID=2791986 RepID=A0ABS1IMV1_9GAMM|nr:MULTISPECIES: hypothetical protein [Limnobaculum]MBK5142846.1 hypothetical protein [Limnobaculum allomyrinae]MBV7690267.1 hypothetical protein [Limnobaculum sp. M2-1]
MITEHPIAGRVLVATLNSWRYFAALSAFAMLFTLLMLFFADYSVVMLAISLVLGLTCHYYCWRLWMDVHLFRILYHFPEKTEIFDTAINKCWGKKGDNYRSLDSRWAGARQLLHRAGFLVLVQWGIVILTVLFSGFE